MEDAFREAAREPISSARDRASIGVFTPTAAALFILTGAGLFYYFQSEKERVKALRDKEFEEKAYGKPLVGGPFALSTHTGQPYTEQNLLGQWTLLYFGFTNCPDICPAEMDKMGDVIDRVDKTRPGVLQPLFISVDPARDSQAQIARYIQDFHPRFVGLTGEYGDIKKTCKAYRVYFSTPPKAKATDDYLVDHSIFIYLMNPEGQFVEAFGQAKTAEDVIERVEKELGDWEKRPQTPA